MAHKTGRRTAKERRAIIFRFGPDPSEAREERKQFEEAFKASGEPSRNHFIKKIVMTAVQRAIGRRS